MSRGSLEKSQNKKKKNFCRKSFNSKGLRKPGQPRISGLSTPILFIGGDYCYREPNPSGGASEP